MNKTKNLSFATPGQKPGMGKLFVSAAVATASFLPMANVAEAKTITAMVQLINYSGDKAYFSMYLVNPKGRYEKTLYVSGTEQRWYEEGLPRWWKYKVRAEENVDGITGASTGNGDRLITQIEIDDEMIDAGYKIRVATSVEDIANTPKDVEFELTTENIRKKLAGNTYVRYVRYKF
ncbi:MAG: DUF2271 domain-containing protein [OCS116 cluster bacterium]|uniref:Flagellin biosynthesis protein FlgD n=1 Tax=OCS116 cluster bacterium TaxID=2030921 RepID=A0A2A4Z459_9PROT|nr:DUF2271 domain-containing protein [OCS116 cluster bacterium]